MAGATAPTREERVILSELRETIAAATEAAVLDLAAIAQRRKAARRKAGGRSD